MIEAMTISAEGSRAYSPTGVYNPPVKGLGEGLKRVRDGLGLEQMDIARKALGDVPQNQIVSFANRVSQVERGTNENPSITFLEQIAAGMGLSISALFLRIEGSAGLSDPDQPVTTTLPVGGDGGSQGAPISQAEADELKRLTRLCLHAADRTPRHTARAILDELAVAFAGAANEADTEAAREEVNERRERRRG